MQIPCPCGHFEMRLTYVAPSVTKLPVDILRRISPLCEKMGLTIKCYVCYVITLMLCFIYFQRFSVKSWLGYLSGTRVLAAWMNCLEGARRSSCGSLKVEIRSGKNHFFKTLITLWQKVTHWLNASQNDRKSKGFARALHQEQHLQYKDPRPPPNSPPPSILSNFKCQWGPLTCFISLSFWIWSF